MNPFAMEEIARLVAEHGVPRRPRGTQPNAFTWYEANAQALDPLVLEQTPKARTLRKIKRIAYRHPWGIEVIQRAMDEAGVCTDGDLPDPAVEALLEEMMRQDDRAQTACDFDEGPPAR